MTPYQIDRVYQLERQRETRCPSYNENKQRRKRDNYAKKRKETIKKATPKWSNDAEIALIYAKRDQLNDTWKLNFEVDHIVPLHSKKVCGLHCLDNLQLLVKDENKTKNNKTWVDD